jgi:hypothetical protein
VEAVLFLADLVFLRVAVEHIVECQAVLLDHLNLMLVEAQRHTQVAAVVVLEESVKMLQQ